MARAPDHSKPRTTPGGVLALLAVGLVASLLIGEAAVRLLPRRWVADLDSVQPRAITLGHTARLSDNPRLYYELTPGVDGINPAGYRGPEYPVEKPPGVRRIVGVGNSTAYGIGVTEEAVYLRRLEAMLDSTGIAVEAVNLAVAGYNTGQELEMLRARGFAFEPDLVILGYDHNDPKPILGRLRPPMPDDYGANLLHSELIRYLKRRLYSKPELRFFNRVDGHVCGGRDWDAHLETLAEFGRACRERGIPVLVIAYDAWIHREEKTRSKHYRKLHEPLHRVWRENGFHVLDCYDLFQELMRERGWEDTQPLWVSIEPRDGHPNPAGHQLIAEAALEIIRENGLLAPAR
jgi:lysophospholipase L1-like esterase